LKGGNKVTIKQAKAKLKKLANGRYHSVHQELTEREDGSQVTDCQLYIDGDKELTIGDTFEECFEKLEEKLGGKDELGND